MLSEIDAAVLLRGGMGPAGLWESGVRVRAGSARSAPDRLLGWMGRAVRDVNPLGLAISGEYEADGGFETEKGLLSLEATLLGGPRGLGTTWSESFPLRWRPWLGFGLGNVFDASGAEDPEEDLFLRAHGRLEITLHTEHVELGAEGTLWAVEGGIGTRSAARASAAYVIARGVSFDVTGEIGRQPPQFTREETIKMGLGLHRPFAN
jgi:hypothetical protein